jgi:thioredoxin 1
MVRRSWHILVMTAVLVPVAGCGGRLPWRSDWKRAMAEAQFDRKPVLLMFSAAMCPRCMKMDKEVFTDSRVREELVTYTLVRIDLLTHADLARQYEFTGTPSFVVFNTSGRVVGKHAGAMDGPALIRFLMQSRMN